MKLSVRQITASAIGAVLSALIASLFGVKGTVIGVAIGSAVATAGTAVVAQSIERTHRVVRQVVVAKSGTTGLIRHLGGTGSVGQAKHDAVEAPTPLQGPVDGGQPSPTASSEAVTGERPVARARTSRGRRLRWPVLVTAMVGVFAFGLLVVTGVEVIAGKPLSRLFGVQGSPTKGASVSDLFGSSGSTTTSTTTTSTTGSTTTTSTTTVPTTTGSTGNGATGGGASSSTTTTTPFTTTTGVSGAGGGSSTTLPMGASSSTSTPSG
ncbi:MAG TPA: hypothetical protein VGL60_01350 [Acidimicrobiales bacterium]|jgi:hypothetical protein